MCSAAVIGAGHVALTHSDFSSIGELDGVESERVKELAGFFEQAGLQAESTLRSRKDLEQISTQLRHNAICAVTGMRTGGDRIPEINAFMDRIIDEALAITKAKGITLLIPTFERPSRRRRTIVLTNPPCSNTLPWAVVRRSTRLMVR